MAKCRRVLPWTQCTKTQCPGATSAQCTCELQRKPLPSRKRNRRSDAAAISVHLGSDDVGFDSVRFANRAFGNRQTLKIREEQQARAFLMSARERGPQVIFSSPGIMRESIPIRW